MELPPPPTRLLFQSTTAFPLGSIRMAGYIRDSTGLSGMRILDAYALVLILAGGGWFEDANTPRRHVSAGDLIVVFPDLPHRYGPGQDQNWSEIYITFFGPAFDLWRDEGLLRPQQPVRRLE